MDAEIQYERFLYSEIDKLSQCKWECDFCGNWEQYRLMKDYNRKKFCCDECIDEYIETREE